MAALTAGSEGTIPTRFTSCSMLGPWGSSALSSTTRRRCGGIRSTCLSMRLSQQLNHGSALLCLAQVEEFVSACKYPPEGSRSYGPGRGHFVSR